MKCVCWHRDDCGYSLVTFYDREGRICGTPLDIARMRCGACGQWLSLGTANDAYETASSEQSLAFAIASAETSRKHPDLIESTIDFALEVALSFDALMSMPIVDAERMYGLKLSALVARRP